MTTRSMSRFLLISFFVLTVIASGSSIVFALRRMSAVPADGGFVAMSEKARVANVPASSNADGEDDPFEELPNLPRSSHAIPPIAYDILMRDRLGVIEGSLGYPSHFVAFQVVCAEDARTHQRYCTDDNIEDPRYRYGVGYQIVVPEGTYTIASFALLNGGLIQKYAKNTVCSDEGIKNGDFECASGDLRPITVTAGQMVTSVDPDWY